MSHGLTPTGPVNPDRIRAARHLRGLTQREVVDAMPSRWRVTAAALSQLESGATSPSRDTLRGLAAALDVPEAFFRARWRESEGTAATAPFFRNLRSTPKRDQLQAEARVGLVLDLLAAVETDVELPYVDVPEAPVALDAESDEIIEAATVVRDAWGLGDDPIDNVVRLLERHGIAVTRLMFGGKKIDAFSVKDDARPVIVLTDDKGGYARSRFDAAHELAHVVMHAHERPGSATVEKQAHLFAAELLMPGPIAKDVLPRRIDSQGWRTLAGLKREWGMSIAALLVRARQVGNISESTYINAMKVMSAQGWRRTEPGDRELGPPERAVLLARAVTRAADEYELDVEDYLLENGLPVADCMDLLFQRKPLVEL